MRAMKKNASKKMATSVYVAPRVNEAEWTTVRQTRDSHAHGKQSSPQT